VTLYVRWNGGISTVPLINAHKLFDKRGIDDEAWKKLLTDTLTKGLSYFGCSSDVFLGCYDDNRYVAAANNETRKRKEPEPAQTAPDPPLSDREQLETRKFLYAAIKQHGARLGLTAVAMRELCRDRTGFESVVDMKLDELENFTRLLSESSTLEDAENA
jgi:hypothetical protein